MFCFPLCLVDILHDSVLRENELLAEMEQKVTLLGEQVRVQMESERDMGTVQALMKVQNNLEQQSFLVRQRREQVNQQMMVSRQYE